MDHQTSRIDARRRCAEALRQLASGQLTNDQFEDAVGRLPDDGVILEMYSFAWSFYDDLSTHRLRGRHRLSPLQRQVFARCVLFLRSGLPYEWDRKAKWLWCRQQAEEPPPHRLPWWKPDESVLGGLTFLGRRFREALRLREMERDRSFRRRTIIDDRIWPFRRMADMKAALKCPPYLAGRAAA